MKARTLIEMLEESGWVQVRQKGSHRIFKHPDFPRPLVVPDHGAKDIPIGTLRSILKQAGLS